MGWFWRSAALSEVKLRAVGGDGAMYKSCMPFSHTHPDSASLLTYTKSETPPTYSFSVNVFA